MNHLPMWRHFPLVASSIGLLAGGCLSSPVHHGTIVVTGYARDRLVFAADSRIFIGQHKDDTACKITVLAPRAIFSAAGMAGQGDVGAPQWSVADEAKRARDAILKNPDPSKANWSDLATVWSGAVSPHLRLAIAQDPNSVVQLPENQILVGSFGFVRTDGALEIDEVTFRYDPRRSTPLVPFVESEIVPFKIDGDMKGSGYRAFGATEFTRELQRGETERAKKEMEIENQIWHKGTPDVLETLTMRVVEASIIYSEKGKVGGPIDAIALNRSGEITWLRRKKNCPAN